MAFFYAHARIRKLAAKAACGPHDDTDPRYSNTLWKKRASEWRNDNMEQIYKYPRTRHLEGSRKQTGDEDLKDVEVDAFKRSYPGCWKTGM